MNIFQKIGSGLLALSLVLPYSSQAQDMGSTRTWFCGVTRQNDEGAWSASRYVTEQGDRAEPSRDTYEWEPKSGLQFGPGQMLAWQLSYYWPSNLSKQSKIPEDDIMVRLKFNFKQPETGPRFRKPERTWLHLYRTTDINDNRIALRTSLIDFMLWDQSLDGSLSTKAVISLGDLLAYGTGFDSLVWHIRSAPNEFGASNSLAKGVFPISSIRNKVASIHSLRRQLDRQAANFKTQCNGDPPLTVSYSGG
jgi:hypothetical protein